MRSFVLAALLAAGVCAAPAQARDGEATADFLFVGSYHMDNPGLDVHNTRADDVLDKKRQREIAEVARLIERYRPTQVMVEASTGGQERLTARFTESCKGSRPLERSETEQLGFRVACDLGLPTVQAVDWNELGPIKDEDSVDYLKAIERHGQQAQYDAHLAIGKAESARQQAVLDAGTVLDVLKFLNSDAYLVPNARAYHRIGLFGTADDPIGANWMQLWFGRNLAIFNNIVRRTGDGDRVLVIYGAGHGNFMRRLALDSGVYRVHDPLDWLAPRGE
jgi:hypothetical protein